jgi:hypothetical protein
VRRQVSRLSAEACRRSHELLAGYGSTIRGRLLWQNQTTGVRAAAFARATSHGAVK